MHSTVSPRTPQRTAQLRTHDAPALPFRTAGYNNPYAPRDTWLIGETALELVWHSTGRTDGRTDRPTVPVDGQSFIRTQERLQTITTSWQTGRHTTHSPTNCSVWQLCDNWRAEKTRVPKTSVLHNRRTLDEILPTTDPLHNYCHDLHVHHI